MEYYLMDQDMEYSSFKLYDYFLKLGFQQEEKHRDYFYIRPSLINDRLDKIDLNFFFDEEYYKEINIKHNN
ncbi:hypothetical protein [Dysgonomonas reticulitermitis]